MELTKLNTIACGVQLPTKKVSELTNNHNFMITRFKEVSTKYGMKIIAVLDDEFQIFLPNRVCKALQENEDFFTLQDAANKYELFITYNGAMFNLLANNVYT